MVFKVLGWCIFFLFLTVGVCFSNINISKVRFIVKGRRRERLYPLGWSGISLETGNKANVLGNQTVDYFNLCNHLNIFGFWTAGWAFEDLFGYFLTFKKTWPWSTTLNHCDMAVVFFFFCQWSHFPPFQGSMFSALVLVFGCLLQRKPVTTEGHHGTNRHIFYAVQMDRGIRGARVLAQQHGLEFIQRVSALLSPCGLSLSIF